MSNHIEWGHAAHSLYTLHTRTRGIEELLPDKENELTEPFILGLWNENGDGLALHVGDDEAEVVEQLAASAVQRETDPRLELDQALTRLHALRQERAAALDHTHSSSCRIADLDEQELDLLNEIAEAAAEVNDQL